ncbi:MAG: tRNA adenylyltransferase [Candidatus Doudnabacteria bacterium CG10_big_fil_rev_8_21_14_0_10_41_10]|uniref:tRNA adenylyltransferase n=1 Tax=Candidatus Doudnabacteria bacterium CG10_big_fil_rev_8_21_14_0_10_41_10 TaxID=1974551 RepID=A0A2H0VC74_9BACT|nr:MAG: tRNA adenylyltransferase [Candidatus Doudnabacteria bacterium CG10_big_fil_rev_8_21_14_0_10_41_10]
MNKIFTKKINWNPNSPQEKLAVTLISKLSKSGFKTFIVGGYVRDLLLRRKETGAIDLATNATPQQVTKKLEKDYKVVPTGIKHGTVTVVKAGSEIEITTFRKEGKYLDARHPKKVKYIKDQSQDASRRDFTINALYLDVIKKEVIDYVGGFSDLKKKTLRFVGAPDKRIKEDALRLMRAVRFASVFGFKLEPKAIEIIRKNAKLLKKISAERIKQELDKIVKFKNRSRGVVMLLKFGLLKQILPEIEQMNHTVQSQNYHSEGNVFVHTMLALDLVESDADLTTLYGLLLHDLGKIVTLVKTRRKGRAHTSFYGHQHKGVEMASNLLNRLRFSNAETEDILWYIKNHHVPYEITKMRKSKQMSWGLEDRFENLLKIFRADSLATIPTDKKGRKLKPDMRSYYKAVSIMKRARGRKVLQKPLLSGNDVMRVLKVKEGPVVGRALRRVREAQLAGKLKTKTAAIKFLKK